MEPMQVSCSCDQPDVLAETARQPVCPVCGGRFVPLGRFWRCTRCFFSSCDGCDGMDAEHV
jgi:hypothetical protein